MLLVSCDNSALTYRNENWEFSHSKLEKGYLKSNDIINISIKRHDGKKEFLRSHDVHFTIGDKTFQEVVCHNERLGENDEVSILVLIT